MKDESPVTGSDREVLSRSWFPSLNHGKILGVIGNYPDDAVPQAGMYGGNTVEVVSYKDLDLDSFPLVEDLYLELETTLNSFAGTRDDIGVSLDIWLRFKSFDHGAPLWLAAVELYENDFETVMHDMSNDRFLGTYEKPYVDGEQGWNICCFEKDGYVHILYGIDVGSPYFPVWFKVRKEKYTELFDGLSALWRRNRRYLLTTRYSGFFGKLRWLASRFRP